MISKRRAVAAAHEQGQQDVSNAAAIRESALEQEAAVRAQLPQSYTVSQWFRDIRDQNHFAEGWAALFSGSAR